VNALVRRLSPSEVARRLGISVKALRLYEQRGLVAPGRTPAGWRAYDPDQIDRVTDIVALRGLGLSLSQIEQLLKGQSRGLGPMLAAHQAALEDRMDALAQTLDKIRRFQRDQGTALREAAAPAAGFEVSLELPWPWGGELLTLGVRPLTYITGPLGSGKTRLALHLTEILPDAAFLGLHRSSDGAAAARAQLDADAALRLRADEAIASLIEDGATESDALLALIVAVQCERPSVLVIDLVEQGLDGATQKAVATHMRQLARTGARRALIVLTRSSAMLDLSAVGPDEAIILCPANHSPPIQVAPRAGAPGYEALLTCLATPAVRARTEGTIAWRPVPEHDGDRPSDRLQGDSADGHRPASATY